MAPGLRPAAMEGGDWTWKMMKEGALVESGVGDRSLRLVSAQRSALMLSSLPSTDTNTRLRFPPPDIAAFSVVSVVLASSSPFALSLTSLAAMEFLNYN